MKRLVPNFACDPGPKAKFGPFTACNNNDSNNNDFIDIFQLSTIYRAPAMFLKVKGP